MRGTLGGQPLLSVIEARQSLASLGRAAPPEFNRCNCLLNPLGRSPARGWFLLPGESLDKLDLNGLHSLVLEDTDAAGKVTSAFAAPPSLVITKEPQNLTAGVTPADPNSCWLVEVADARHRAAKVPCVRYYNVRAGDWDTNGHPYYADSMHGTKPWPWSGMAGDLWALMAQQLGGFPGLPASPSGVPEGWQFPGVYAWDALCEVLWRAGCAVAWNAPANRYAIVRVGGADPALATLAAAEAARRRVGDSEYAGAAVRGRLTAGVLVCFKRQASYYGSEETARGDAGALALNSVHQEPVNVGPPGAEPGTQVILWDDLPALYDAAGTLTNLTDLQGRANERAQDHFRMALAGGTRLRKTYAGIVAVSPGPQIKGVAYRQVSSPGGPDDGALVTDVVCHPYRELRSDDHGMWESADTANTPLQPPDFRQGLPAYPALSPPAVRVVSDTPVTGDVYAAFVRHNDLAPAWADAEAVWALDMTEAATGGVVGGVTPGTYPARLLGQFDAGAGPRPLYAFRPAPDDRTPCRNVGDSTVPLYGVVRVSGADADGRLWVAEPDADGQYAVINAGDPIAPGADGWVTAESPARALYEGGTPANGEVWGPKADSYKLHPHEASVGGASNASPIVITEPGHGRTTGDTVTISGVTGNTAANGTWVITVVDADHYSLDGSTGDGDYTSGGTVTGDYFGFVIDGGRDGTKVVVHRGQATTAQCVGSDIHLTIV
jgi:hypothetical protein